MSFLHRLTLLLFAIFHCTIARATDYYFSTETGSDKNDGLSTASPMQTLEKASGLRLIPGDRMLFAAGERFAGTLMLRDITGTKASPIAVSFYRASSSSATAHTGNSFLIDAKGKANGILIENCSYLSISNAEIIANGYDAPDGKTHAMRVGLLLTATGVGKSSNILLDSLNIHDIFFERPGFTRGKEEVKTANGTQRYGWGIRLTCNDAAAELKFVTISNCHVSNVSHTGIKLTGKEKNLSGIEIANNIVTFTGGPGIQMSEVKKVHVHHNSVDHSGSSNDSRKWGRGSGLWTWSSSEVLIEHNRFTYAEGPGDSAGAHIDYNCDNIVLQYNFSAWNAGGFCEILGNNYNCAYRYNISVNDGRRIKGENGAFQEGKIFWLSGYQGDNKPRKGPVNSYFYNNTIYVDSSITARIAIDATSSGILIANNIFSIAGKSQSVLGDQYKPDDGSGKLTGPVIFTHNLWLSTAAWPADALIADSSPTIGNPYFTAAGSLNPEDYLPKNTALVAAKGITLKPLPGDESGLMLGLNLKRDFTGAKISGNPPIGAIVPR